MILFFAGGRLGNQIFQYAFLNTIAKDNELIVSTHMEQLTNTFEVENKNFKQITLNRYCYSLLRKFIKPYILNTLVKLRLIGYIKQNKNKTSYLPTFISKKGFLPITLIESHYFQSEVFFDKNVVDIKIKERYIFQAKSILNSIPTTQKKVFVHVRRGDYLFEEYLGESGIELPNKYFLSAIEIMKKKVENPYFIFLSDDPGYCESLFKEIEDKYISNNDINVDLALMTLCEYGIVSNSSFSWWGAYLMKNRKKVIFPKYWLGWKQKIESNPGIQPEWASIIDIS
ncbi:alpha-1,2-fucosyltransferase [bacterium]|jgi:hypothetical protein|nr:alpha-1,2-fucosyltransferase [bacterium]